MKFYTQKKSKTDKHPIFIKKGASQSGGGGFTLIEMMVAVAVFTLLVGASSGIFVSSLRGQKQSLALQEVLSQTSYLMEYMSKAVRMATKDIAGDCTGTAKLNYAFQNQCLKFKNYQGTCQQFCLAGARLQDGDGNYLTSASSTVSAFNVTIVGAIQPPTDYLQPKVTIFLRVTGQEGSKTEIQTTISQRNPDVRK
ncbi:MAG: prepilin-type N-terminal cleavage/methylation domain-containing protein [Patescibacteria group bacterium]